MAVRSVRKLSRPAGNVVHQNPQTLGAFSGVAQDGPARKARPVALAEELVARGCAFVEKGIWDEAEREFRKALKMAPEYPEAYNNLGLSLLYDGRPSEACEALQEAVRLLPGWHAAEANLALAYQQLDRNEEAANYYRISLTHNPQQAQVRLSMGDALNAAGRTDDALSAYNAALEKLPNYGLAYSRIGMLQARRGKINEAENALLRAVQLDPSNVDAYAVLGAIAARRGNITQAKDYFAKVSADPAPVAAQRGRQRIALSEAAVRKGLDEWKAAQPGVKPLAECYYDLGLALIKEGREDEARGMFQCAAQHAPDWAEPQIVIGLTSALQGNALVAKASLEAAAKHKPDDGAITEQLGYVALGMGMTKEADILFKKARSQGRVLPPEIAQAEN
jgi:Flp pilus assembly protein TadD